MPTVNSSNPVVRRAHNATNASAASSDVLAYVKRAPYAEIVEREGDKTLYTSQLFWGRSKANAVRRKVEAYLSQRVDVSRCKFNLVPSEGDDTEREEAFFWIADIPASAVRNSAVAKNARASVLVSFNAITAKGLEKVQAKMSADDFEAWAKKVGVESSLQSVWFSLMKGEDAHVFASPVRILVKEI